VVGEHLGHLFKDLPLEKKNKLIIVLKTIKRYSILLFLYRGLLKKVSETFTNFFSFFLKKSYNFYKMANLTIDIRGIKEFYNNFSSPKAKGKFLGAIRRTNNDMAFVARKQANFKEIPKAMITRTKFNQRSTFVQKAKFPSFTSFFGARSIFSGNSGDPYKGLKDIELGGYQKQVGVPTIDIARGGSKSKKIRKAAKYQTLRNAVKLSSTNPRRQLAQLSNRGYKKPFKIRKNQIPKLKPGYYKFVGRRKIMPNGRKGYDLVMIRDTEKNTTRVRNPKKWLLRSTKHATRPVIINRIFIRNVRKSFKPRSKR